MKNFGVDLSLRVWLGPTQAVRATFVHGVMLYTTMLELIVHSLILLNEPSNMSIFYTPRKEKSSEAGSNIKLLSCATAFGLFYEHKQY